MCLESPAESLREIIPLGRGVRDVQLLVLNAAGRQAGVGEHGEVYLRSPHLAAGYRSDPSLTAQRFLPNPFSQAASDRMYRTGDLGRYLPNGMVECLGRAARR
jgi:non-ribosomal peptide synthetase component F